MRWGRRDRPAGTRAQGLEPAEEAAGLGAGHVGPFPIEVTDPIDQARHPLAHPCLVVLLVLLGDRPLPDVESGLALAPAEVRELDGRHWPVLGEVLALAHREVVDAELQAFARLGSAVGPAALVVGDPGPAVGSGADPVDLASDRRAVEGEREDLLGRGRRWVLVPLEPVGDDHVLGVGPFGLRDRVGGEAGRFPALVQDTPESVGRALDLAVLAVLDDGVHELADPRLESAPRVEPELAREHVLEVAVLERRKAGVRQVHLLALPGAQVRPVALEPPPSRVLPEREDPLQGREPLRLRCPGVGERPAPERARLADGDGFGERQLRGRDPLDPELLHEPGREHDARVTVRVGGGEHDPTPRSAQDHGEQAPLLGQSGPVDLCPRWSGVQRAEVEHRLGTRQAGEVAFEHVQDDHGVEPAAGRRVRGQYVDGVELVADAGRELGPSLSRAELRQERLDRRVRIAGEHFGQLDDRI